MRLFEFDREDNNTNTSTPDFNLLTALELLRNRYKDEETPPKLKTQSLINLVLNTDRSFDYDALVYANDTNPAIKNLIKSFNREYVILQPYGDESEESPTTTNDIDTTDTKPSVNTVKDMASRAALNRGAPVSYDMSFDQI